MDKRWREFSSSSPREQPPPQGGHGWEVTQDPLSSAVETVVTGWREAGATVRVSSVDPICPQLQVPLTAPDTSQQPHSQYTP